MIPIRPVVLCSLLLPALAGCSSVGVGAGISVPVLPGVSIGVGVGSGGVQLGVGAHAGPVGAGVGVNQDGRVTGNVGVGAVLYDPSRPPPSPSR